MIELALMGANHFGNTFCFLQLDCSLDFELMLLSDRLALRRVQRSYCT